MPRKKTKRKSKKKRTITPEHLAKMQAGREKAQLHRSRMSSLGEREGLAKTEDVSSATSRMLDSVRRK